MGESLVWDVSANAGAGAFDDNLASPATGDVSGAAARRLPFPGAPRTWYAVSLTGSVESNTLLNSGDTPDQGEPEFGSYQKSTDTLRFSATDTARVKGLGFDAAVEAMRLHLIAKGFIEQATP